MFYNLASNSDRFGKLIVTGSGGIYDMRHYLPKMPEEYAGSHVPVDEHGFFRFVISDCIAAHPGFVDLRLFGVFGRYEDYAIRFISNAICKALFDLPITLRQNRRFDYLYVKDLFPVVDHFLAHDFRHSEYNVTPDQSVELLELAGLVRDISGKNLPVLVNEQGMGTEYSGDNSRLRSEMPGLSFTGIAAAVEALYGWYRDNLLRIDRDALLVDK